MSVGTDYAYGQGTSTVYQREQQEKDSVSSGKVTHNDFLKLLTKQLTTQDPLNPMQDLDFTAQLAQLQALDEQMAMTKSMQAMRQDSQFQAGTSMIGKYISGTDEAGNQASGQVSRVVQSDGNIMVELANKQRVNVTNVSNVWNDAGGMYQELANSAQLIDKYVDAGVDSAGQPIRGIVEKIQVVGGEVKAKLYNGELISLNQIKELRDPTTEEVYLYCIPAEIRKKLEEAQKLGDKVVSGIDTEGNEVSGMVCQVEFDQATFDVYLVLYGGEKIHYDKMEGDPRDPTAADASKALKGKFVEGLDENAQPISGIVVGAVDNEDGLALVLEGGKEVYFDALTLIRDATDKDKPSGGESGGEG